MFRNAFCRLYEFSELVSEQFHEIRQAQDECSTNKTGCVVRYIQLFVRIVLVVVGVYRSMIVCTTVLHTAKSRQVFRSAKIYPPLLLID